MVKKLLDWQNALNDFQPTPMHQMYGFAVHKKLGCHHASLVMTHEYDMLRWIDELVRFSASLARVTDREAVIEENRLLKSSGGLNSKVARKLFLLLRKERAELEEVFPSHRFNPYVTAFFKALSGQPRISWLASIRPVLTSEEQKELKDEIITFVRILRAECKNQTFQKALHGRVKLCRKNHHAGKQYVDSIFRNKGSRHLVLRIELSYNDEGKLKGGVQNTVTEKEARSNFTRWIRYIRQQYPVTGYMAKLEYGTYRGYHHHVVVFLDGHLIKYDGIAVMKMGRYWEQQITEGQGTYFNCNEQLYKNPGIGMINYSENEKIDNLKEHVIAYLTKTDFWLSKAGGKWFTKGEMPEEFNPQAKRRGRPREH